MRRALTLRFLATSLVLGFVAASPCRAASGAWSPRSSAVPPSSARRAGTVIWTHAGPIRVPHPAGEIAAPARSAGQLSHSHTDSNLKRIPRAALGAMRRHDERSSSSRTMVTRSHFEHPATRAGYERTAKPALFRTPAGVFHDAHAPPARPSRCRSLA